MGRWLRFVCVAMPLLAGLVVAGLGARAEDEAPNAGSYLALYPPGDVYQVEVIGDDIADGLLAGLTEAFQVDPNIQIKPRAAALDTLMRSSFTDQLKSLDETLAKDQPTIAVVMIGPQDRVSIRGPNGRRITIDSDDWREEFGRQVDTVMKLLKRAKQAVYWVGLPNVRRSEPNEDAQILNEIVREKVYLNGFKYIDAYAGFADEGGGYSAMGPDIDGKVRLLREANGVAFTDAGNRKLAHFVEREIRRDMTQAKSDRTIPLAGNDAEQAAINASRNAAAKLAKTIAPGLPGTAGTAPTGGSVVGGALPEAAPAGGVGDQKADSGRINLGLPGVGGRDDVVSIDLLRPAIPATVIALVSRKENADKATQMGDLLIDQIPGGLMVMSSITPANDSGGEGRRRLAPTQTPYFRVMVKGERATPREGRADDMTWPRPEPPPVVEAQAAPTPAVAAEPAKPEKKTPSGRKRVSQPKTVD